MSIDRRALLGALGLGVTASAAQAQETPSPALTPPAAPSLEERITTRASENRYRLEFDGSRFSGAAWDMLVEEGRAARFFCLGEEHGIAENPKFAAQMFAALAPSGYSKACVEISPPMAAELDRAARGGMDGVRGLFADPRANVAFFGMREESEWIAAARAAAPGRGQAIWGLDYEVGGFGRMLDVLRTKRKPRAAQEAFAALDEAAEALWAQFQQMRGPQFLFSFAGDPALVAAVREAWPNADAEAAWMLEALEETTAINRLWTTNQGWASNERRARFNRANFRRYWDAEERKPRVFFKFGGSHMVRALTHTQVLDVGNQVSELAEARGEKSFHLLVLPGATSQVAQFNPSSWTYAPAASSQYRDSGFAPLMQAAYADVFTLIDLRPVRPLVFGRAHKVLDADLVRNIHGFDGVLILSGSTPSANL